jgi:hypothetical protein
MKKAARILLLISGILYVILGFLFAVIEGRLFFSFDWLLYSNPVQGGFAAFFRFMAALLYLATGILAFFLFSKKEHPTIAIYVYIFGLATFFLGGFISAAIKNMAGPTPLYITLPIALSSDLFAVGAGLYYLSVPKAQKSPSDTPKASS